MAHIKKNRNMSKNTQNPAYQEKAVIASEIREALKPYINKYTRVYTEPRVNGLRTKFWRCKGQYTGNYSKLITKLKLRTKYPQYDIRLEANVSHNHWYDCPETSVMLFIYDK